MTPHEEARALMATGEPLTPEEDGKLVRHLAGCATCRQVAEEYARQDGFLRALRIPEPAAEVRRRVLARVDRPRARRRRWGVPLALGPAAAAVLLLFMLTHAGSERQPGAARQAPHAALKQQPSAYGPQRSAPGQSTAALPLIPAVTGTHVETVSQGLRLSLSVPRASYPRNALIIVSVRAQNVTRHAVKIATGGHCGWMVPWAEVTARNGRVLYPPALPNAPIPRCPYIPPRSLKPGQAVGQRLFVVLRYRYLRAAVALPSRSCCGQMITPLLALELLPERAPRMVLRRSPRVEASVIPGSRTQRGRLYVDEFWTCSDRNGINMGAVSWSPSSIDRSWGYVRGTTLRPGCTHPREWSAVAGWVGHPVVSIAFKER